ncbi:MAG: hypothetical protein MI724_17280 [Spirochaetales bacterium]|nr:hypothetical protein [Spirochaetales bacterium]
MNGPYELSVLVVDLLLSGGVAFAAIMLWSLTRSPAWMLIIIGLIIRFGDVAFQTLDRFGIIAVVDLRVQGIPVFWMLMRAVPLLFIAAGLIVMIRSVRI